MTTTNFLHRESSSLPTAQDLVARLRELEADRQRIELSQALLQLEVNEFSKDVAFAAQHDPAVFAVLQAEARLLLLPAGPAAPVQKSAPASLDLGGDFTIGVFDEDLSSVAASQVNVSPPFGPTTAMALQEYSDDWNVQNSRSWGGASAPSNVSSSPPSSLSSPFFSPMDGAFGSFDTRWASGASLLEFSPASNSFSGECFSTAGSLPPLAPPSSASSSFDGQYDAWLGVAPPLVSMRSQVGKVRVTSQVPETRYKSTSPYAAHQRQGSVVSNFSSDIPISPELKPLSKANSVSRKRSIRRAIKYDLNLVVKNQEHMFAVHVQGPGKADEGTLTRLYLDHSSLDPHSPLGRALLGEPYTAASFARDCELRSSYTMFTSTRAEWTVRFTLVGPSVLPAAPVSHEPQTPTTFLHFLPGDLVVTPSFPLGSRDWRRMQQCPNVHAGYPGDGAWTARYDDEAGSGEKRRPARILGHFAKCCPADDADGEWSLMKLARLMRAGK